MLWQVGGGTIGVGRGGNRQKDGTQTVTHKACEVFTGHLDCSQANSIANEEYERSQPHANKRLSTAF